MTILTTHLSGRRTVSLAVLVLALAVAVAWALRPASDAAPAPSPAAPGEAGTLAIDGLRPGPGGDVSLPVLAFATGGSNSGGSAGGGGGGAGRFNPQDVSLTLDTSATDPLLLRAVSTGVHFPRATISLAGGAQEWVLEDVTATSVAWSTTDDDGTVALTLAYEKVRLTATDGRGANTTTFCYNAASSVPC